MHENSHIVNLKKRNTSFGKFGNSVTFKLKDKSTTKKLGNYMKKNKIMINYSYQNLLKIF